MNFVSDFIVEQLWNLGGGTQETFGSFNSGVVYLLFFLFHSFETLGQLLGASELWFSFFFDFC